MRKNLFSFSKLILAGTLAVGMMSTVFVGCKNYDDDINSINNRLDAVESTVEGLTSKIGSLGITSVAKDANGNLVFTTTSGTVTLAATSNVPTVPVYTIQASADGKSFSLYKDGKALTPAISFPSTSSQKVEVKDGVLYIDGVAQTLNQIKVEVKDGYLYINDLKQDLLLDGAYLLDEGGYYELYIPGQNNDEAAKLAKFGSNAGVQIQGILSVAQLVDQGINSTMIGYINDTAATPVKALFNEQYLPFRLNPTNADTTGVSWNFLTNEVVVTRANQDEYGLFKAVPSDGIISDGDGAYGFKLAVDNWHDAGTFFGMDKKHFLALEATLTNGAKVVSDYVKIEPMQFNAYVSKDKKDAAGNFVHYRTAQPNIITTYLRDTAIVYNATTKLNVNNIVKATAGSALLGTIMPESEFSNFGFNDYRFEFENIKIIGADGVTDQSTFISLADNGEISVLKGSAAIDRRPVIKVTIKSNANDLVLAVGYIAIEIVRTTPSVSQETFTYTVNAGNIPYANLFTAAAAVADNYKEVGIDWNQMNSIYTQLGLSHNDFNNIYGALTPDYGTSVATTNAHSAFWKSTKQPNVDTYAAALRINPYAKFGANLDSVVYTPTNVANKKLVIRFTYNVVKPTLDKTILEGYRYNNDPKTIVTKGMNENPNVAGSYKMQLFLGEAFAFGSQAFRDVFAVATANKVDFAKQQFVLNEDYLTKAPGFAVATNALAAYTVKGTGIAAGSIDETLGSSANTKAGVKMGLMDKLTEASRSYKMLFNTIYVNEEVDGFDFTVIFVNPLVIKLATPANFVLTDKVNGQADSIDVKDNYIVTFGGKNMVVGGVAQDGTNGTIKCSDYVDITATNYGLFYTLTPSTQYLNVTKVTAGDKVSKIQWKNAGTRLQTTVKGGEVVVKFVTEFAEITKTADELSIKPE